MDSYPNWIHNSAWVLYKQAKQFRNFVDFAKIFTFYIVFNLFSVFRFNDHLKICRCT